jgi:hypothetical protein
MKALALFLLAVPLAAQIPDAPKPQPYFTNTLNRALVASDTTANFLDALSTYQFEHDPCNCIVEKGKFYWTFSLAPISKSTVGNFSYRMADAVVTTAISRKLWSMSQRHHSRILRLASRGVLIADLISESREPINNWRLISTGGKKGF